MKPRFVDDGTWLYEFSYLILVRCPRCDRCAKVIVKDDKGAPEPGERRKYGTTLFAPRRLVCGQCGYTRDWEGRQVGGPWSQDPYFHQPLWLMSSCRGETLWAYNEAHLDYVERFVRAELRQTSRGNIHTLANKLPKWVQLAKNREEVLKCIEELRNTIPR